MYQTPLTPATRMLTSHLCVLLVVTSRESVTLATSGAPLQSLTQPSQTKAVRALPSGEPLPSVSVTAPSTPETPSLNSLTPASRSTPQTSTATRDSLTSPALSSELCRAAAQQCPRSGSLGGGTTLGPDDVIPKAQLREALRELQSYVTRLIDAVADDINTPLYMSLCSTTTPPPRCTVSEWSEWSAPFGFGTQERTREIIQREDFCPEVNYLVERSTNNNLTAAGYNAFEDVDLVSTNLYNSLSVNDTSLARDILVLVDSSGSISQTALAAKREGLKNLVSLFCDDLGEGAAGTRLAVVQFSKTPVMIHSFQDEQSPEAVRAAMESIKPLYGLACTGQAFNVSYAMFDTLQGARQNASHYTLLVTDGHSSCREDVKQLSQRLQQRSAVLAIGVGVAQDARSRQELADVVSDHDEKNILSLASWRDFLTAMQTALSKHAPAAC